MKKLTLLICTTFLAGSAFAQMAKTNPEAAVRAMEERWEAASQKHDSKTIGDMIASDFIGVGSKNQFMTKASLMDRMRKDTDTYSSMALKNMQIRSYGPNTVIAVGDSVEKGTGKDGKAFDRTYRFTDTWVARNGSWLCVGEQVAQIAGSRAP